MSRVLAGLCSSISSQILAPLRGSQACSPCAVASKACSCRGLRFTSAHLRAHSDMSSVVAEKFVKGGVVPDVITTAPVNAAKVCYSSIVPHNTSSLMVQVLYPSGELDFGNVMTPTQVGPSVPNPHAISVVRTGARPSQGGHLPHRGGCSLHPHQDRYRTTLA